MHDLPTHYTIEIGCANRQVEQMPRLRGRGKHRIDYRHIIDWLVRRPGAFENHRYREGLFPTSRVRMVWDTLRELAPAARRSAIWRFCIWRRWKAKREWMMPCEACWRRARPLKES